jgi:hypothetical protein
MKLCDDLSNYRRSIRWLAIFRSSERKGRPGTDRLCSSFSFKFFFQCKAFWYSFCCCVSDVFCSLHTERCFRLETTPERYFFNKEKENSVSVMLYLYVLYFRVWDSYTKVGFLWGEKRVIKVCLWPCTNARSFSWFFLQSKRNCDFSVKVVY